MFSWLFGPSSRVAREDLHIWRSQDAKFAAIGAEIRRRRETDRAVIVVVHFRKTLQALDEALRRQDVPHDRPLGTLGTVDIRMNPTPPAKVFLASSDGLSETVQTATEDGDESGSVSLILAETYPIRSREEQVESFAEGLPFRVRLSPHASLDELLFEHFGAERVKTIIAMLDSGEGEGLQHPAIAPAIRRAQRKVARRAPTDERVDTPAEWFHYNYR